jgi:beta-phosphoglucomutase-like phosphatase (HAD superfamily)
MYDCFIFDFDGVIVATEQIQIDSLHQAIKNITNISLTSLEDINLIASTITSKDKLIKLSNKGYFSLKMVDAIYEEKKRVADKRMLCMNPDDSLDKFEVFRYLKAKGKKLLIVTNANKQSTTKLLKHLNLFDFVDFLITNGDVNNPKPHSEPYIRAMLLAKCDYEKCIIFEDSDTGFKSATGTGVMVERIHNSKQVNLDYIKKFIKE